MKIAYEILSLAVDRLYPPHYTLKPGETIDQHLKDVETFIYACGWTPQEYFEEYVRFGVKNLIDDLKEMN